MRMYHRGKSGILFAGIILFGLITITEPVQAIFMLVFFVGGFFYIRHEKKLNMRVNLKKCTSVSNVLDMYKDKPTEFEKYVAELYKLKGYKTKVTPAVADGGIDIYMEYGQFHYGVECKLFNPYHKVDRPMIQKLESACRNSIPKRFGIFVTTSYFSIEAIKYANQVGIELIDGRKLEKMIRECKALA